VRGGSYPERVFVRDRRLVIQAIAALDGSDRMPEIGEFYADGVNDGSAFIGLHFTGLVTVLSSGHVLVAGCRHDMGLNGGGAALRITRCVLGLETLEPGADATVVSASVATLDSCTVYGPVTIWPSDSTFVFDNRFENVPNYALRVGGRHTLVARNQVRGGAAFQAYLQEGDVRFEDNDIEGCRGWGIDVGSGQRAHPYLERNRIAHCGTVTGDTGDFGIRILGSGLVRGNLVLDCRGPGIVIDQGLGASAIEDNVIGRCGAEGEVRTVGRERGARQVRRREAEAMGLECELAREICGHQVQQVRTGGDLEARCKLARDRGAADRGSGLEHEHLAAAAGEVRGAHQSVVTAADHDAVVACAGARHGELPAAGERLRSLRTACAQLAPGAPMTPPPGWVLEPHRYNPRSGERYCA